jgi:hypothetical protein
MRNILTLLIFVATYVMAMPVNAQVLQGPRAVLAPYPPVLSQPINALPEGTITINVGHETYYYYNGAFYQMIMRDQKYIAVPPPIGAVVFSIPSGYQYLYIDGTSYYVYGGVYYKRVLEGYRVIYPPENVVL